MEFSSAFLLSELQLKLKECFCLIIYKRIHYDNIKNRTSTTWSADVQNQTEPTMDGEESPQRFFHIFSQTFDRKMQQENRERTFSFLAQLSVRVSNQLWGEIGIFQMQPDIQRCFLSFEASSTIWTSLLIDEWKKKKSVKFYGRYKSINQIRLCL